MKKFILTVVLGLKNGGEYGNFLKDKKHEVNFAIDGLEDTHHFYRVILDFIE